MLPLLRKKQLLSKKRIYFAKLWFLSAIFLTFLLFLILFIYRPQNYQIITITDSLHAPVVLLPFAKKVPGALQKAVQTPVVKKKSNKTQTTLQQLKNNKSKQVQKKPTVKKVLSKQTVKKEIPKKQTKPPIKPPIKPAIKKAIPKKEVIQHKQKIHPTKAIVVGQQDLDTLELYVQIIEGIKKVWHCPALKPSHPCQLTILVDAHGIATIIKEESSYALAWDVGARNAVMAYTFPKQLRGGECTLIF